MTRICPNKARDPLDAPYKSSQHTAPHSIIQHQHPISRLRYLLERSQILCLSEPSAALTQTHEAAASITLEAERGPKDNREWPDLKMLITGSRKSFCFGLSSRLCCLSGQAHRGGEGGEMCCFTPRCFDHKFSSRPQRQLVAFFDAAFSDQGSMVHRRISSSTYILPQT